MTSVTVNLLKFLFYKGEHAQRSHGIHYDHHLPQHVRHQAGQGLTTYVPERTYHTGEVVIYNGSLMFAIRSTSGAFTPTHWQKVFALDSVRYRGMWNADKNDPLLSNGTGNKGDYYVVSVSGSTELSGTSSWNTGDWVICNGNGWDHVINGDTERIGGT